MVRNRALDGWWWCTSINPSTQGGRGRGISMSLMPAWPTEGVSGQPEIHREGLSWKKCKKEKERRI